MSVTSQEPGSPPTETAAAADQLADSSQETRGDHQSGARDATGADDPGPAGAQEEFEVESIERAPLDAPESEYERFIPVSRFEIIDRMTRPGMWPEDEIEDAKRFFRYLAAWRHIVYKERLDRLEEAYHPFNPEADVVRGHTYSEREKQQLKADFLHLTTELLIQANYTRVEPHQLVELIGSKDQDSLRLEVELDEYEECHVYRRGAATMRVTRKRADRLYLRSRTVEVPIYQRVFVLLKLKPESQRIREIMNELDVNERKARRILKRKRKTLPPGVSSDHIYIKMFRDIPRADIEMLFPNTRIQFRPIDKIKIAVTGGGGTVAGVAGTVSKLLVASNPISLGIAVFGLGGLFARQVSTVIGQRNRYMMTLARNLYFHSMADNRGVITLLANRAEEEDVKEEVLLYTVLAKERVHESELPDVQAAVEQYLESEFKVAIAFDAKEALNRLIADKVVVRTPDGYLEALSPYEGRQHLDELWDGYLNPHGEDRQLLQLRSDG